MSIVTIAIIATAHTGPRLFTQESSFVIIFELNIDTEHSAKFLYMEEVSRWSSGGSKVGMHMPEDSVFCGGERLGKDGQVNYT